MHFSLLSSFSFFFFLEKFSVPVNKSKVNYYSRLMGNCFLSRLSLHSFVLPSYFPESKFPVHIYVVYMLCCVVLCYEAGHKMSVSLMVKLIFVFVFSFKRSLCLVFIYFEWPNSLLFSDCWRCVSRVLITIQVLADGALTFLIFSAVAHFRPESRRMR